MNEQDKNREELIYELQKLREENDKFRQSYESSTAELKKAEEALRSYRLLFENNLDALLLTEPTGSIISVNMATCKMFGRTAEDICQIGRSGIIDTSEPRFKNALEERTRTGSFSGELTGIRIDGTKFPVEVSSTLFTDHDGKWRTSTIIRDITERKLSEKALQKSEKQWRKLVQTLPDYVALYDRDGKYLFLNRFAKGFSKKDIEGKTYTDLLDDESKPIYEQAFNTAKQTNSTQYIEHIAFGDNSNMRNYESYFVPIFQHEEFVNMMVIARDITERKQTEEAIIRSKQQYDELVSIIPVGVYILRTKPDDTFALEYASPKMAEILDLSVESLLAHNENIFKAIHPDDLESFARLNLEGIQLNRPFDWKGRAVIKGNVRWLHISSVPKQQENGDNLWHGLVVDITDQMSDEEEIKNKNKKLQELNATKDKFFSIIAHDLRTPFNSFLGLTQIMAEDLPSLTMAQVQGIAVTMSKSATNLYRLLENLLHWARMQQGAIPFHPKTVQLRPIIDESIEMIQGIAKSKRIDIATNIPDGVAIFADTNLLQTVIRNLVSNAVKFTSKGGKVTLMAKATNDKNIEISIQDTGIGMDQALVGNLFQIDIQTSRKGTEGEPSTGLGLILCKEFVEKHGGKIWAESEEGKGSVFTFVIPGNTRLST